MQDINSVTFTARLTKDPEVRETPSGKAVGRLRVAIQRPSTAEGEDRGAAFYDVEVWNGTATSCGAYLSKGSAVAVQGRLEHQEWTDEDGKPRQCSYVVATMVRFLDPLREAEEDEQDQVPAAA